MSKESAKQFINRMQEDKEFAGVVEKLGGKEERAALNATTRVGLFAPITRGMCSRRWTKPRRMFPP